MSRTGYDRGFSLIEVMVAASILALGAVMIYQSFFISLDAFNHCRDYLTIVPIIDEKMWDAQDTLKRLGSTAQMPSEGKFIAGNRDYRWELTYHLIDSLQGLYKIDLVVDWREGRKSARVLRSAYEIYEERE
ncbi:MAG: prepilin-type N-terminal cleavage/methylation domain-containing protein [Candidatus Omnitrophota bacterium]